MYGYVRRRHVRQLVLGSPGVAFADRLLRHSEHREEIVLNRFNQLVVGIQVVPQRDMANKVRKAGSVCTINVGNTPSEQYFAVLP